MWKNITQNKTKDLSWAVANQIILSLGAVAIIVVLSNVLDAQAFGKTRFLVAALAIFAFFSLPGIGPVVLQQMPIYSYEGFFQALKTQIKWGSGATVGAFLLAIIFYFQGDYDLTGAFFVAGLLAPIANLHLMPGTALAGVHKFRQKTLYDGTIIASTVLGIWYGALVTGTVMGTIVWYYGVQSLATAIALYLVKRHLESTQSLPYDAASDTRYGKQLTLFQIPFTLLPAMEKVLVFVFLGPAALAIYIIAFLPIEHIRNAYRNVLQFFVLPKLHLPLDQQQDLKHLLAIASVLGVGSIVAIVLFAFWLLPIIFPDYTDVRTLMLFSAIIPLALPAYIFILKILSERKTGHLYSYALVTILVDILAFTLLTSQFGLRGAVTAKIVTSFIAALVAFVLYRSSRNDEKHEGVNENSS